jgi:uncharacterized protein (TIGR00296 family)
MLTLDEGKTAVRLAREALTRYVDEKKILDPERLPSVFDEKRGVFVTLHEDGDLRGCIGYPQPVMSKRDCLRTPGWMRRLRCSTSRPRSLPK